jgi:integrase
MEARALTLAEVRKVLAVLRTPEPRLRFGLFALTGIRRGEGTHLRWSSVDSERGVIRIEPYEGWQPKTGEPRVIPICRELQRMLKAAPRRSIYVLTTKQGRPFFADNGTPLLRWFKNVYRRAGLERPEELNVHSARHGYISRLAQLGVRVELRAKLAGHRSLSMHQDVYTHTEVTDALEAGRRLHYA